MGLFDLLDDIKGKNDRRRQAEEYRRRAKEYVRDGQEIYEKAYSDVSSYSYETKYKVEQHYSYKQKVIKEFSSDIAPVLSSFSNFNIDSKVFDTPSISGSISGIDLFGGLSASFAPTLPIPSIFDLFEDADEEYYEARRQSDEAKSYHENMKYEREKLRNVKENMRAVRSFIDDEKRLIENMVSKLKNISTQLKTGMTKSNFSKDEAEYLKELHKIAVSINDLVSTKFLNDNFTVTNQYQLAFNKIKEIDSSLAAVPLISDGSDSLRKLLEVIDRTISK